MKKQIKKLIYEKMNSLISNNHYVIVGQYNNQQSNHIHQLKRVSQLYIPKNSFCSLYIQEKFGKKNPAINMFEGPIFILGLQNIDSIREASVILRNPEIRIFGGIFNKTFVCFEDLKMFFKLILDDKVVDKTFHSLNYSQLAYMNLFSMIPTRLYYVKNMEKAYKK